MAVAFEAVGTGTGTSTGSNTASRTHSSAGGAQTVAFAFVSHAKVSGGVTALPTVSWGGTQMVRLYNHDLFSNSTAYPFFGMTAFALFNPPSGSQTVTVTASGTPSSLALSTVSYTGVAELGAPTLALAPTSGTSMSITVPTAKASEMVVFAHAYTSNTTSAHNQTTRVTTTVGSGTSMSAHRIADAAGTGSTVTGTATVGTAFSGSGSGRCTAIRLKPAQTTTMSLIGLAEAATSSVTIPAGHQAGDLMIAAASVASATPPTKVSGWTDFAPLTGSTTVVQGAASMRIAWKIAASSSEVSGTWTGATRTQVAVYRNAAVGASVMLGTASGTGVSFQNIPGTNITDLSRIIRFCARTGGTGLAMGPGWGSFDSRVGFPLITALDASCSIFESQGTILEAPGQMNLTGLTTSVIGVSSCIEVVGAAVAPPANGNFFAMF